MALLLLSQALLQNAFIDGTNRAGLAACLLFLMLYIVSYQCVDAPSFIWATEVWPTTLRAKGVSLAFFTYFVGGITYTTPSALAFKNMYVHSCDACLKGKANSLQWLAHVPTIHGSLHYFRYPCLLFHSGNQRIPDGRVGRTFRRYSCCSFDAGC